MAGIGFQLRSLALSGSPHKTAGAYAAALIITSGVWCTGGASLAILALIAPRFLTHEMSVLLIASLAVIFIASLIVSSVGQLILTRYLADRHYLGDTAAIAPTYVGVLMLGVPLALLTIPFVFHASLTLPDRLLVTALFVMMVLITLVMVGLSASRNIWYVTGILGVGALASIIGAIALGAYFMLSGALIGYLLGQNLCLSLAITALFHEYPTSWRFDGRFLRAAWRLWDVGVIGLLFALGSWGDNLILWASSYGISIGNAFRLFPPYDCAKALAYLLTLPAGVIFMMHIETNFEQNYRQFARAIDDGATLATIIASRRALHKSARRGLRTLALVQGVCVAIGCAAAPGILMLLGTDQRWVTLTRIIIVGMGMQFLLASMIVLLLWLDRRRCTLMVVALAAILTLNGTLLTLRIDAVWLGFGFLGAMSCVALFGWLALDNVLGHLERTIFLTLPVVIAPHETY